MKLYHDLQQGSPEWLDVRRRNFTASELGEWALEPLRITLTVDDIKAKIDAEGLPRKGVTKKDDLLAILSDAGFAPEPELCDGAKTAILSKIKQGRFADMMSRDEYELTPEESIWLQREIELQEQCDRQFSYNIPIKYGNQLEPYARQWYEETTGFAVSEVGFIEHDSGGFGCSPDGIIWEHGETSRRSHGVEIKCPVPETHLAWLLDGGLPDCHRLQVHASMAVSGLSRWDFLSYCPGERPLIVTVEREPYTDQLEAGLKTLVAEKAKMMQRLAQIWRDGKGGL